MDDTPKAPRKGRKRTEANGDAKPAFDKSKGLWVVWVWINGKRVKRSSKSKATALLLLKDLQRLKAQGVDIPPDRLTIAEWVKMWIATKRAAGLESGSIQRYEEHYRLRVVPILGKYSLLKLTSQHIQNSVNALLEEGLARATVTFYKSMVSAALDDAVRKGMLPRNVALGVMLPRLSRAKERSSLSPAQARAFLQAAAGHKYELIFWLGIAIGGRRGELCGLRWSGVDWKNKTVTIAGQVKRVGSNFALVDYTKGKRTQHVVRLPGIMMDALEIQRDKVDRMRRVAGDAWEPYDLVFPTSTGRPIKPDRVTEAVKEVVKAANKGKRPDDPTYVPDDTDLHTLRHTSGSFYVMLGASSREVQDILGHKDIDTTQRYLTVLPVMTETNADRMGGFLERLATL